MPINFYADINLDKQEIEQVSIEKLSTEPGAGADSYEGRIIYTLDTNTLKYYDGSNWIDLDGTGGVTSVSAQNGLDETGTAAAPVIEPDYTTAANIILSAAAATTLTTSSTFIASVGNAVEQYLISDLVTLIGAGVSSFTNVNGTFISATTVNTAATGAVTMGTVDLSATGTPSSSTFLRGDNSWSAFTPATSTYVESIGNSTTITVTHSLDTLDVIVQLYNISNGQTVFAVVDRTGVDTINVVFSTAPSAASIRCLVSAM